LLYKHRSSFLVKVSEYELRIATIEKASEEQRRDEHEFQAEMRPAIAKVTDILSEVRVQLGGHHGSRG
jgi:hypothetical protein